ncbi:probable aldo-keto reductase 1 [Arachis stenosperma]|uniref:probable aldo-keto reductase 1 n=1 Tax=Arachis stenosperma TaxID=217475 RepID=UPI0025AC19D6|nr:probable aldo-keto reductase 1 [Arachis stenosperma]
MPFVTAEDQKTAMAKASKACAFLRRCHSLTLGSMLEEIAALLPGHEFVFILLSNMAYADDDESLVEAEYRKLGSGIVFYSPLGRGFFGGKGVVETLPSVSSLSAHPWYQAENIEKNKRIYKRIESFVKKYECTTPQLALAWVLQQGNDIVPIPVN